MGDPFGAPDRGAAFAGAGMGRGARGRYLAQLPKMVSAQLCNVTKSSYSPSVLLTAAEDCVTIWKQNVGMLPGVRS